MPSTGEDQSPELTFEDVASAAEQIGAPVDAIPDDNELMCKVLEVLKLQDTEANQMAVLSAIERPADEY